MRTQDIEAVREQRIFTGVDPTCVDDMLHASFLQRFPPHVELVSEGEPADFLYVVIEGQSWSHQACEWVQNCDLCAR